MQKKGQGLPLNVIVIAIIVLVVLVVIISIFMGKIVSFDKGVSEQSKFELIKFKPSYGSCHPTASEENNFLKKLADAQKVNSPDDEAKARSEFQQTIANCAKNSAADCSGGCTTA